MPFKGSLFLPAGRQEQMGSPDFSLKKRRRRQFVMTMNDVMCSLTFIFLKMLFVHHFNKKDRWVELCLTRSIKG